MSLSIAIAENHCVTRRGVRSVVERSAGSVVAAAETGLDALSMVETHKPNILILSLDLPRLNGFEVLRYLRGRALVTETVVLTTHDDKKKVLTAFERGATAYVLKQDPLEELGTAVAAAAAGESYLSSLLPESVTEEAVPSGSSEAGALHETLTQRQREVLRLTADGCTGKEIGEKLDLSPRTIEQHRRRVRETLGCRNQAEMTRYAVHLGIYSTPQPDWLRRLEEG